MRNQCDSIIGYALGDDAEVTDAGNSERWLISVVAKHVDSFLDIGANIGDWTSALLQENNSVAGILLEPVDWCYERLCDRFRGCPALSIRKSAAGSQVGVASFHIDGGNAKTSSFNKLPKHQSEGVVEVQVTTVDCLLRDLGNKPLGFLKVDCEGFDAEVLRGARASLEKQNIALVQFEYNNEWHNAGNTLGWTIRYLNDLDYDVYLLRCSRLMHFDYKTWGEFGRFSNFVAFPKRGHMAKLLATNIVL